MTVDKDSWKLAPSLTYQLHNSCRWRDRLYIRLDKPMKFAITYSIAKQRLSWQSILSRGQKMRVSLLMLLVVVAAVASSAANASKYQLIYQFGGGPDGGSPQGPFVSDRSGNLYGVTHDGGDMTKCSGEGCGTVFKLSRTGVKTILYSFIGGNDGENPRAGLLLGKDGNLYGTTWAGGTGTNCEFNCGTVFKVTPGGSEAVIYSFKGGTDGGEPWANLIEDAKGNLYGTTFEGGNSGCEGYGCGTVFKIAANGAETVLYAFGDYPDGFAPESDLVMDNNGNLFGTAGGGEYQAGVVFEVTPSGTEKLVYTFKAGTDGNGPIGGLLLDDQGNLFGTTEFGGSAVCNGQGCGTLFEISANGKERVVYSFLSGRDGAFPNGQLISDGKGNLYGVTQSGNTGVGTVFKLTQKGALKSLYQFGSQDDGARPTAGLLLRKGYLYGVTPDSTDQCNYSTCGTAFEVKK
jgi:uncharacterized repeat protein (TIGR03803 family)